MILRFHDEAYEELVAALAWYLERSEAASDGLFTEFRAVYHRASEHPNSGSRSDGGLRRFPLRKYPFVVYVHPGSGRIVAFAHASRRPGYFLDRLPLESMEDSP